nr:gluconokinase [Lacticaseibacillus absianus]
MTKVMIGVDIGTTSTKVVLFDAAGQVLASANNGYPLIQTQPDMAEQDPEAIWAAVQAGVRTVAAAVPPALIAGVSFSAAMHSLMLVDPTGRPMTRLLTWADNRAQAAATALQARPDAAALFDRLGVPLQAMTPLAKLMRWRQTQPAQLRAARWACGIKDYVLAKLTDQWVQDASLANATGLFDRLAQDWDTTALALAGVSATQLPRLVETTATLPLTPAGAAALALPVGLPCIVGASDGVLSNLGVGAQPGDLVVTVGTSGAVRQTTAASAADPAGRLFTYTLTPGQWVVGGPINNGGDVLRWVRDTLMPGVPYDAVTARAAQARAGSDGLLFLPYLNGERAPLWTGDARGSYLGLTARHGQPEMIRAAMEGVVFALRDVAALVLALGTRPTRVLANGGFANSPLWCQMLADVFEQPVTLPAGLASTAWGAARLGWQALGVTTHTPTTGVTYRPGPDATRYGQLWPVWQQASRALLPLSASLATLQRDDTIIPV